jgi:hypothetical protein
MTDAHIAGLTANQVAVLGRLLKAGFTFVSFEKYARFIGVEKEGFVALLDPGEGHFRLFSQVGYRMGDEIGMLVVRQEGKAFVCHDQAVAATAVLLETYARFREELDYHLHPTQ